MNRCANKCIVLFLLHTHSQHRIVHFLQKTVKPNRTHTLPGPPLFTNCSLFASCTSTTTSRVDLEKRFLNSGDYQTSWYLKVPGFQTMWSWKIQKTAFFRFGNWNLSIVKKLRHYSKKIFSPLARTGASHWHQIQNMLL